MATKDKSDEKTRTTHGHTAEHKASGHKSDEKVQARASDQAKEDAAFLKEHGDELSRSTQRAKWIHSPSDHEDHPGQTLATRSHEVIQHWAEERKAKPATIKANKPEDARVLRFDFPGFGGENLQEINWDEWFKPFDERDLVFVFQEHQKAGNQSNFFRLDSPEREDA